MSSHQSPAPQEGDPFFRIVTTTDLRRRDLEELAAGLCGAVQVPGVLTEAQCERFMAAFDAAMMERYDPERYGLPIDRLGPALNEHLSAAGLSPGYWPAANAAEEYWRTVTGKTNIRASYWDYLCTTWGPQIERAVLLDRDIFWGIVREADAGTLIHWDEAVRETRRTPMQKLPVAQLACNLFVAVPDEGGETSIWRHRWQPQDELHRVRFGYSRAAVDPHPYIRVTPAVGDAVFFDPRNFHRVEPAAGAGRRVSLSMFLGVTATGTLTVWS
jgi:hypothetical protein